MPNAFVFGLKRAEHGVRLRLRRSSHVRPEDHRRHDRRRHRRRPLQRRRRGEGRRDRRRVARGRSTAKPPRPSTPPGMLVTPGFVDVHTHYDGQATWDPILEPSSGHGVTTIVAGNCGVGFAPVRPGAEEWLIELMEGVEDIPGTALTEGIDWSWETFPEYLDALDRRPFAHRHRCAGVARRGARVRDGRARRRQRARHPRRHRGHGRDRAGSRRSRRARLLDLAHARPPRHGRRPVPGTFAAEDELFALGRAMAARRSCGVRARADGRGRRGPRRAQE